MPKKLASKKFTQKTAMFPEVFQTMWQLTPSLPNHSRPSWLLSSLCIAPLVAFASTVSPVLAQSQSPVLISLEMPPASGSAPQRTAGAGVRGNPACIETHPSPTLIALVPDDPTSLTFAAQPEFFVYIPPNSAQEGIFSLSLSEDGYGGYTQKVILSGDPGVIRVTLPEEVNLKVDEEYYWKFSLQCQEAAASSSIISNNTTAVQGVVKRIAPNPELNTLLSQTPEGSIARASLYAQRGIWHEATSILYGLRDSSPQQWTEWLSSVQLEAVSSYPSIFQGSPTLF